MHDLGKAVMPLDDPEQARQADRRRVRGHAHRTPSAGTRCWWKAAAPARVLDVCLHHHERVDGTGYPHSAGRRRHDAHRAHGRDLRRLRRHHLQPALQEGLGPGRIDRPHGLVEGPLRPGLFAAFVRSLGIYPVGSLVRPGLGPAGGGDRAEPASLTAPQVKIFFSTKSNMPVPVQRLDLSLGSDRITGRESATTWGFKHLDTLWAEQAAPRVMA
jgi:hypothetical protein